MRTLTFRPKPWLVAAAVIVAGVCAAIPFRRLVNISNPAEGAGQKNEAALPSLAWRAGPWGAADAADPVSSTNPKTPQKDEERRRFRLETSDRLRLDREEESEATELSDEAEVPSMPAEYIIGLVGEPEIKRLPPVE